MVAPVFVAILLVLLALVASPPLPAPLWSEKAVVVGVAEALMAGVLTAVVVVFKSETVELIA